MYRCQRCNVNVGRGIPCTKVVTETREKRYVRYGDKGAVTTMGSEIVKEESLCRDCAKTVTQSV